MYGRIQLKKVHGAPLYAGPATVVGVPLSGEQRGGNPAKMSSSMCVATPIVFTLFRHCKRRAAARDALTAGRISASSRPTMASTTNSSTSVKPRPERRGHEHVEEVLMSNSHDREGET